MPNSNKKFQLIKYKKMEKKTDIKTTVIEKKTQKSGKVVQLFLFKDMVNGGQSIESFLFT